MQTEAIGIETQEIIVVIGIQFADSESGRSLRFGAVSTHQEFRYRFREV